MFSQVKNLGFKTLGSTLLVATLFSCNLPSAVAEKPSETQNLQLQLESITGGFVVTRNVLVDVSPGGFIESADLPFPSSVSVEGRRKGRFYEIVIDDDGQFITFLEGEAEKGNSETFSGYYLTLGLGVASFIDVGVFEGQFNSL